MNQEGLLFPKTPAKKKKKKHGKCIMPGDKKGFCYICGATEDIHRHHVFFGTANKEWAERYGLTVHLCVNCHELSPTSVHQCRETNYMLKRIGQRAFEREHGTRKEFMKVFGKNYLEEEEMDEKSRVETCKHSTGRSGNIAIYTLSTCPNMHLIKGKYVTAKTNCKNCRFYEERK